LRDLNPWPLNACVWAVYAAYLDDLVEFEEVYLMKCIQVCIVPVSYCLCSVREGCIEVLKWSIVICVEVVESVVQFVHTVLE
jgi:hypothetical protein